MAGEQIAMVDAAELALLLRSEPDDDTRLRMCIGWLTELAMLDRADANAHVAGRPSPIGDQRWDAMVAGLVQHLASHDQLDAPPWVDEPDRFLDVFWFPVDLPSVRVSAFRDAPAALARRGVFLDRRDLERV
jgi:hypothetical protein